MIERMTTARIFGRSPVGGYLRANEWIWARLPSMATAPRIAMAYGRAMHALVRAHGARRQYLGTFFLRNRPQLELIRRLAQVERGAAPVRIAVLGCSIGAEVYSLRWWIGDRSPDLDVVLTAVDISEDVLGVAREGVYTARDAALVREPIFARMSTDEVGSMFDRDGDRVRVKPGLREGIRWEVADARDPGLAHTIGVHDLVVANDFLCHMEPAEAERCLRNIARLVERGGHVVVSGVDLDVRTKVARALRWLPVSELLEEVHDGDPSLRSSWPWRYWGLEPLDRRRPDWRLRYASAFRVEVAG